VNEEPYESTVTYHYDAGNRLTSVVDSVSGTITPVFDNLDRLYVGMIAVIESGDISYFLFHYVNNGVSSATRRE
jgi:hypothetical protein